MALGDPYITSAQLAAYLNIPSNVNNTPMAQQLAEVVLSASSAVEDYCGRQFNSDTAVTTRVYSPASPRLVAVDDFWDLTNLVIKKSPVGIPVTSQTAVWPANWFELWPLNGVVNGRPGFPYNRISMFYYVWLYGYDRVYVTTTFGWQRVPDPVIRATYLVAAEQAKLADAPLGVAAFGGGASGQAGMTTVKVTGIPQAASLLEPYKNFKPLVG